MVHKMSNSTYCTKLEKDFTPVEIDAIQIVVANSLSQNLCKRLTGVLGPDKRAKVERTSPAFCSANAELVTQS